MISKNNITYHLLFPCNSGHFVKLLSNVSEILFQIRHLLEIECQIDKNKQVRHLFAFNQCQKAGKAALDICVAYEDDFISDGMTLKCFFPFQDKGDRTILLLADQICSV